MACGEIGMRTGRGGPTAGGGGGRQGRDKTAADLVRGRQSNGEILSKGSLGEFRPDAESPAVERLAVQDEDLALAG